MAGDMSARTPPLCTRKRKAHTKSRRGCQNCKLRRIKCDERRPSCVKCRSFGVSCTYDRISSELQPFEETVFSVNAPLSTGVSLNQTVLGTLNEYLRQQSPDTRILPLDSYDLELLNRFHERTILTIGSENTRYVYQAEGLKLAVQHPFLMHVSLTLTMMHSRSDNLLSKQSAREAYHWYLGTSQFNKKLASPHLTSSEKDAIWIASALLGCTTLAHMDADDPEEAWPLKEPSATDLNWLKLSTGKKASWRIADLSRPDSALHSFLTNSAVDDFVIRTTDLEAFKILPPELSELCGLGPHSTPEDNPYHAVGAVLGRLLAIENDQENVLKFFTFLSHMPPEYQQLLDVKDPRAILIMLWYQAQLGYGRGVQWWAIKRTIMEGEAMIRYLERYHSDLPNIDKLLEYPKRVSLQRRARALAGRPRRTIQPASRGRMYGIEVEGL